MEENLSQNILKKQLQRQLTVLPQKQTSLSNRYTKENCFRFFLTRNMSLTNVLSKDKFIERYQISDIIKNNNSPIAL